MCLHGINGDFEFAEGVAINSVLIRLFVENAALSRLISGKSGSSTSNHGLSARCGDSFSPKVRQNLFGMARPSMVSRHSATAAHVNSMAPFFSKKSSCSFSI